MYIRQACSHSTDWSSLWCRRCLLAHWFHLEPCPPSRILLLQLVHQWCHRFSDRICHSSCRPNQPESVMMCCLANPRSPALWYNNERAELWNVFNIKFLWFFAVYSINNVIILVITIIYLAHLFYNFHYTYINI